jgi:hypothetical protein
VLLVIVSEMKLDTHKQELQQVVKLGGIESVAAFCLELDFQRSGVSDGCKSPWCTHVSIR